MIDAEPFDNARRPIILPVQPKTRRGGVHSRSTACQHEHATRDVPRYRGCPRGCQCPKCRIDAASDERTRAAIAAERRPRSG